jgi:hypothetical protein
VLLDVLLICVDQLAGYKHLMGYGMIAMKRSGALRLQQHHG